jgi:CheY-like chemotaxis protein
LLLNEKQTVLVVDDTPENLTVLGELLQPNRVLKFAAPPAT